MNRLSKYAVVGITLFTVIFLNALMLWGQSRGYDYFDEGITLLQYTAEQDQTFEAVQSGVYINTIMDWMDPRVIHYRWAKYAFGLITTIFFSLCFLLWVSSTYMRKYLYELGVLPLGALLIIGGMTAMMYGPMSIHYNTLTAGLCNLSLGFFFLYLLDINKRYFVLVLVGGFASLIFYIKWPSSLLLIIFILGSLFFLHSVKKSLLIRVVMLVIGVSLGQSVFYGISHLNNTQANRIIGEHVNTKKSVEINGSNREYERKLALNNKVEINDDVRQSIDFQRGGVKYVFHSLKVLASSSFMVNQLRIYYLDIYSNFSKVFTIFLPLIAIFLMVFYLRINQSTFTLLGDKLLSGLIGFFTAFSVVYILYFQDELFRKEYRVDLYAGFLMFQFSILFILYTDKWKILILNRLNKKVIFTVYLVIGSLLLSFLVNIPNLFYLGSGVVFSTSLIEKVRLILFAVPLLFMVAKLGLYLYQHAKEQNKKIYLSVVLLFFSPVIIANGHDLGLISVMGQGLLQWFALIVVCMLLIRSYIDKKGFAIPKYYFGVFIIFLTMFTLWQTISNYSKKPYHLPTSLLEQSNPVEDVEKLKGISLDSESKLFFEKLNQYAYGSSANNGEPITVISSWSMPGVVYALNGISPVRIWYNKYSFSERNCKKIMSSIEGGKQIIILKEGEGAKEFRKCAVKFGFPDNYVYKGSAKWPYRKSKDYGAEVKLYLLKK